MFIRFFALIVVCGFALYWFHLRFTAEDIASFHHLIQESTELRTRHALEEKPAFQKRHGVQKDLFTQDQTHHYKIQSEQSELVLSQKKEQMEVIETLSKIQFTTKDDFFLTADEGIYTFPSHQFIAKGNCHLTHQDHWMDGEQIQLDLDREIVTYDHPSGYLSSGPLHFKAKKLVWNKKEGKISLFDEVVVEREKELTISADRCTLFLDKFDPLLLVFQQNVRLISSGIAEHRETAYAIADILTYDLKKDTLLCASEKKVLFWQEGLELSASEVLVRKDRTVEGHGDVHFTFDLEEKNFIDQLFKQYL